MIKQYIGHLEFKTKVDNKPAIINLTNAVIEIDIEPETDENFGQGIILGCDSIYYAQGIE